MAQISPFLPPIKQSGTKPAPGGGGASGDLPQDNMGRPMVPIAGFWRRLGAFILDMVALFFFFRFSTLLAGDALLALGDVATYTAALLAYLYFALGDGPVGKGRTLGKFLVGIRTTSLDGNVPRLSQGLVRALLLLPWLPVNYLLVPLVFDLETLAGQLAKAVLPIYIFGLAYWIGLAFAVIFNPFRQGLHDFAAKTMVRPAVAPSMTFDELTGLVGENWRRFYIQSQINGAIPFLLLSVLFVFLFWPSRTLKESSLYEFDADRRALATAGLDIIDTATMIRPVRELEDMTREETDAFLASLIDDGSTATLRIQITASRNGAWPEDDDTLRAKGEAFLDAYHDEIFVQIDPSTVYQNPTSQAPSVTNLRHRPMLFELEFKEYVVLFYPYLNSVRLSITREFPPIEPLDTRTLPPANTPTPQGGGS